MLSSPPLLTTKQHAELGPLALRCGQVLPEVVLGYEAYGELSPARDNVVLLCHFFSGNAHAAGRYRADEALPGWWDAVVGPGKAIDTRRWCVLSVEALGCVRVDAPHGRTTNPNSLNPATGRPYGPDFPPIDVRDMVAAQKLLLDHLGVRSLVAVAGPSLGGAQALAWAQMHPDMVPKLIAAIAPARLEAQEIALYRLMKEAIRLDPAYQGGHYPPEAPPRQGLALAMGMMIAHAGGRAELAHRLGRRPHGGPEGEWAVEAWLQEEALRRSALVDANAWIAMLEANMRWDLAQGGQSLEEALAELQAKVLLLPGLGDALLPWADYHQPLVQGLAAGGREAETLALPGTFGHLAGLAHIGLAEGAIRAFLEA